jgi:hypothetical protein
VKKSIWWLEKIILRAQRMTLWAHKMILWDYSLWRYKLVATLQHCLTYYIATDLQCQQKCPAPVQTHKSRATKIIHTTHSRFWKNQNRAAEKKS